METKPSVGLIQTLVNVESHASSEVKLESDLGRIVYSRRGKKRAHEELVNNTCNEDVASGSTGFVLENPSTAVVAEGEYRGIGKQKDIVYRRRKYLLTCKQEKTSAAENNDISEAEGGLQIVPFEEKRTNGKQPIPKLVLNKRTSGKLPIPKVKLKKRTIREWKASIGKGTSKKEDRKYWAKERREFHDKVKLFISRVERIQGEMKLSNWKGSVLDSLMGAYLTQNVNDTLSSSVFISLLNKYPNRPSAADRVKRNKRSCATSTNEDKECPVIERRKPKPRDKTIIDWFDLRKRYSGRVRVNKEMDCLDWEAARMAKADDFAQVISRRGQQHNIGKRMQNCLRILVEDLGNTDLEWMRNVPPNIARDYLWSMPGMGQKCVECVLLLSLKQKAFPIDTNAACVFARLGWVPIEGQAEFDVLETIPKANSVQKYLWPRLCQLEVSDLYELHCQVITLGKVFCTKRNPNCSSCPMRDECKYNRNRVKRDVILGEKNSQKMVDIEDFSRLQIVPLSEPKKKSVANIRKHQVYVLPDSHPSLKEFPKKYKNDSCPYLLATWTREINDEDEEHSNKLEEEEEEQVDGTILIPIRRAMSWNFPLGGTHFQANELFADSESCENPIKVTRASLSNLASATLHCAKNLSPVCTGMESEEVQKCFHQGYTCFRSIDLVSKEIKSLHPRFFYPVRTNKKANKPRSKKIKLGYIKEHSPSDSISGPLLQGTDRMLLRLTDRMENVP